LASERLGQVEESEMKGAYSGRLNAAKLPKVPGTYGAWPKSRKKRLSLLDLEVMQIPEATDYDDDDEIIDPVELVREFKRHPQFCEELRRLTEVTIDDGLAPDERANLGRPRMQVRWDLLYLGFVASRDPAPYSFRKRWLSSPIWEECGFEEVPHYNTIEEHFIELETMVPAFRAVKQLEVRQAKRHCEWVGRFTFYDHTGWQSHATIQHAPPEVCEKCAKEKAAAEKAGVKWKKPGRFTNRLDAETFEEERSKEAEAEEFEKTGRPASAITSLGTATVLLGDEEREVQLFKDKDGHTHFSYDTESGLRKYKNKRAWFGGLGGGFVDVLLGVGIAFDAFRADDAEFNHYPDQFEDLVESTGEFPIAVSIDAGNAVRDLYEYNTCRGVATVGPRRKYNGKTTGPDWRTEDFDEHGHPRCTNCNAEGLMDKPKLGWYRDHNGDPRLRFRCGDAYEDACKGTQSIACSEEWLLLQPLTITHPIFQTLRSIHSSLERVWGLYRKRYAFAGKDATGRLKRLGVSPQRLRGEAALLIDWFRVLLRRGWIGSWKTQNENEPVVLNAPAEAMERIEKVRRARGLDVPYGKRWERLKERLKKKRRKPHTHGPPGQPPPTAVSPPDPPPKAPPPEERSDGPKIWLPPPDLDRR
jgi:hypothetical protein